MRRLATPRTASLLLNLAPVHNCRSATATAPGSSTSESRAASGGSGASPYAPSCGLRQRESSAPRTPSSSSASPTIASPMISPSPKTSASGADEEIHVPLADGLAGEHPCPGAEDHPRPERNGGLASGAAQQQQRDAEHSSVQE